MTNAYIYDHLRTPRGRARSDGALHAVTPVRLTTSVLESLRARSIPDTALVDDIIMGVVAPVGEQGQCLPRIAAIAAGWAESVAGVQINRFCSSGLESVNMGAAKIMAGQADMIVSGGVESMSRVPMLSDNGAWGSDPAIAIPTNFIPQGVSADLIATIWGYSRSDLDALAVESHRRAAAAWDAGYFDGAIAPVIGADGKSLLSRDEILRPNATLADMAALKPAFAAMGAAGFDRVAMNRYPQVAEVLHLHHAGNSSGMVDGAAAVLLGNEAAGRAAGLRPRARIRAWAEIGSEPTIMLTAPSFAAEKALKRAGMSVSDIDLFEINEAFAAIPLRFIDAMGIDPAKVNVNGGAIAMGHPLGATGAMILGTALDELERRGLSTALVTLCVGAGMGVATIIERV